MLTVTKTFRFEAAHYLSEHQGKCKDLHGHSYKLLITVEGSLNHYGMIMDFGDLKHLVEESIIEKYDHKLLNEVMVTNQPTAEVLTMEIVRKLQVYLADKAVLQRVRLYETEGSYAEWERDQ